MSEQGRPLERSPGVRLVFGFVLLSLAVLVYMFAPMPDTVRHGLYDVIGAVAVLMGLYGLRRHRPERYLGWLLVLLGYAGWVSGDVAWSIEQALLPDQYPAPSDAFYLGSYLLLGTGALVMVRTRHTGRDLAAVLDALIITTGMAVLVGVVAIAPLAGDTSLSGMATIVTCAYPVGDLFLVGVITRMYAAPGSRTPAYRLFSASLLLTLGADLVYDVLTLMSGDAASSRWTDGVWLTAYLLAGASACVPSMRTLVDSAPVRPETEPTRTRLAALSGGLMLPAVALFVDGADGDGMNWVLIGIGIVLLSGLILARMAGLLQVVRDQSARLGELARVDALTGAPNRRTWDHELARRCAESAQQGTVVSVAMLDLDRFKAYNDTHGHQAGDLLLVQAVAAWSAALPPSALLARYGGEEFAVVLPDADPHDLARHLHRLRALTPAGQTFSAGVALWDPSTSPERATAAADEALYCAKRDGRDRIAISGLDESPSGSLLPTFSTLTQPIVDLSTSEVCGHEVLIRFTGEHAECDPQEVRAQAHSSGHGDPLELLLVQGALSLPGRPRDQDLYVEVSVQALISPRLLTGLPRDLRGVVLVLSADPGAGGVSATALAAAFSVVQERGGRIALADVGAGAPELARLSQLRPDVIRVGRALVHGCHSDAVRTAVLRALVIYAADLGVTICVKDVEDSADLLHLARLGITHAQGAVLARPGRGWQVSVHLPPAMMRRTSAAATAS